MTEPIQVLIVEDSQTQATRLRLILQREGYDVVETHDGVEALAILEETIPAIVISDVVMPEMDGFTLCRSIKTDARLKEIPVVLLTALSEPEDVFKALQAGADNFITKPYENHSLLNNLRRILSNLELRNHAAVAGGSGEIEVIFNSQQYRLDVTRTQMADFLLSTYESALHKYQELDLANQQLQMALESNKRLQQNYHLLLETNVDAVVVVDRDGVVRYANPAANSLLVCEAETLEGMTLPFTVSSGECREFQFTGGNGETVVAEMRVVETDWDNEPVNLAVLRDITEHVRMREELRQLSLRDGLTGLYNRRGFTMAAEQLLRLATRDLRAAFIMYIDLDGMKRINDTFGHQEGDVALCDIAHILLTSLRKSDVIGRMGGDEFAVIGLADSDDIPDSLEERIQQNIRHHNTVMDREFELQASVGIDRIHPNESKEIDRILERADERMYQVKRAKHAERV